MIAAFNGEGPVQLNMAVSFDPVRSRAAVIVAQGRCAPDHKGAFHIGIDTVKLKGEHYKLIAKQGIEVKKGDPIVEVDLDAVRAAGYQVITPMVISNHSKFSRIEKMIGVVEVGDTAIVVSK